MIVEKIKVGDEIYFAGRFYEVAEIKDIPNGGKMIGIFDDPPSNHVDYLNPTLIPYLQYLSKFIEP